MNNEAIQRLREPAAWVLLGSVAAKMIAMVISAATSATEFGDGANAFFQLVDGGAGFLGVTSVAVILVAVLLMITAKEKSPRTFGVVLTALILLGIGAFFAVISLITGFFTASGFGGGMVSFIGTGADIAVAALVGLVLFKVFTDQNLVPRAQPSAQQQFGYGPPSGAQQPHPPYTGAQQSFAPQQGMPQTGGQQPYPPQTGGQQPFAQQPDPNMTGMAHQQPYTPQPDPNLTGQGQQPYEAQPWQPAGDPGQPQWQQSGGQAAFQQAPYTPQQAAPEPDWSAQQASPYDQQYQQNYQGPGATAAPSGGQPTYDWSGQQVQQQQPYSDPAGQPPYAGQSGYDPGGQQPGYEAYSAQPPYGTGGQPSYGADPFGGGASPQGYDQGQAPHGYGVGAAQSGSQPSYGPPYASTYEPSYDQGQALPPAGGPQHSYGDDEATVVQNPGTPGASASEQAAQEAIQYGWYQQPAAPEPQAAEPRRDTPLDDFFRPEQPTDDESTSVLNPGYGNQFSTSGSHGASPQETTSPYGENYGADQQKQQGSEYGDGPQGWYRDDGRR